MPHRSLTHFEATERAATVRELSYQLDVDLTGATEVDASTFRTVTTVRFATDAGAGTFLEVRAQQLRAVRLNGRELDLSTWSQGRLPLAGLAERNTVVVEADYAYTRNSQGMHRFVDPVDGNVYVYAQPSITDAPRFMACFDQPDLKAPVTLSVTADPSWSAWANGPGSRDAADRWTFTPTPPIATYLITVVAGPYVSVADSHDGIPLSLIARASYAEVLHRDAAEIFEITKAAFDRFHELFGVRYPFGKYDQAFVPEFSWGAMEFPGCVVFRDEYLFHAAVTDTERLERAAVIAHEMAHMWFGDLVTMRWWDDLWLNESFATYMGYRLTAEVTRWPQAWTRFGVSRKTWGYAADQRPSTHPIAPSRVADTDAAFANFDGISYAKGCSALRQLVALVGDDAFFAGLRAHFDKHAWGNATLADLLATLSEASGRDLDAWAEIWLRSAQVNTLRPVVEYGSDGGYTRVAIEQTAPAGFATLRPHRIGVGWGDPDGSWQRAEVEVTGALTEVPALTGVTGRGLLLNDGDLTFAKIRMDDRTRAGLAELLINQPDSLNRAVWWNSAFDATRDAEWPAEEFVELVAAALPAEREVTIVESILVLTVEHAATRLLPAHRHGWARDTLHETCQRVMATGSPYSAEPGSGRQLSAARGFIATAGPAHVALLAAWLTGESVPSGLSIDSDLRWAVLARLAALGAVGEAEIEAELALDGSAHGEQEAARCRASRPDPAAKAWAFDLVVTERGLSNRLVSAAGDGLWQPDQAELTDSYVERYFTELPRSEGRSGDMLKVIAGAAYPRYAVARSTVEHAERALAGEMHPLLRRAMVDHTDDLRRALRARDRG